VLFNPGSGIVLFLDPGSKTYIFESLQFLGFKSKIIFNFVIFVATKKDRTKIFFHPSLLLLFLDPRSGMDKNQDPGSRINIPDPQHCIK
jgi:hypothetical protein